MAAPKPIGQVKTCNLDGFLIPWSEGQPAFIEIRDDEDAHVCLPVFTTKDKLEATMANAPYDSIKQIDDGPEFLTSIPGNIRVVIDLYRHENGKLRWVEVKRD